MASFKEASVNNSFNSNKKVSMHIVAAAEDSKWFRIQQEVQNALPAMLELY